jgi:hypothetical protein
VALGRRFRSFAKAHLPEAFFNSDAVGRDHPLPKADLDVALQNAYQLRSKYVHNLRKLPDLLIVGRTGDVTLIDHSPMLTFEGITRLAREVIIEFIKRQPQVEKEVYDYRLERPGVIQASLAASHWGWAPEHIHLNHGKVRLQGFMEILGGAYSGVGQFIDMSAYLKKVASEFGKMTAADRRCYMTIYFLFHRILGHQIVLPDADANIIKWFGSIDGTHMELVLWDMFDGVNDWPLSQHLVALDGYIKQRNKKSGLRLSRRLEAALMLRLAERYRLANDLVKARESIGRAIDFIPGYQPLLEFETRVDLSKPIVWRILVYPETFSPKASSVEDSAHTS